MNQKKLRNRSLGNLPWMFGFASDGEEVERALYETNKRAS